MNGTTAAPRFGAQPLAGGGTRFALWAPACERVALEWVDEGGALLGTRPMTARDGGWFELDCPDLGAGTLYRYRVRDDLAVPDPASRFNPQDVHGPSEVIAPDAYVWQQPQWRGRPWRSAVIYEMHVGAYTPEGRYDAAARRLPMLRDLGVTAIELMPLADFPGRRNWGYDGVLPYAPDASYGRPDELKRFIDEAHGLGLMVLLDVVYNHFGPDGNYLGVYAPDFFDASRHTPWGAALNMDGPNSATVRRYFVENALYWTTEFRFDGLRMDAVHAIQDRSSQHLVLEIADALRNGPGREREVHLVLENDDNTARWLARRDSAPLHAVAQWNDDLHHAAHALATGEREGYYEDYHEDYHADAEAPHGANASAEPGAPDTLARLGVALAEGYVYQGQPSRHRGGVPRGEPSRDLPGLAFIAFLQNHDQIGNRAFGERLDALAGASQVDALLACLLLAPQVPMLFMGEEYAARTPFLYFCDAHGELADAIREGRRREFARFAAFSDPARREAIPDPNSPATFEASRLDWRERETPRGRARWQHVQSLLRVRRTELEPLLERQRDAGVWRVEQGVLIVEWTFDAPVAGAPPIAWRLRARLSGRDAGDSGDAAATSSIAVQRGERSVYAIRTMRSEDGATLTLQRDGVDVSIEPGGDTTLASAEAAVGNAP